MAHIEFNFADRSAVGALWVSTERAADHNLARDVLCSLARPLSCNMQSQQNQIGDLAQSAAFFWQKWPEMNALAHAFYLLLADLELEQVFAEFVVREERNQIDTHSAGIPPAI